jgi:hypothetical protein
MTLTQTKVVDYTVKWLKKHGWKILFVHYPEGHYISPEYGLVKIIERKVIDIIALKGDCLFLIECDKGFKPSYVKKLLKINKKNIKNIDFTYLIRGVAFNIPLSKARAIDFVKEDFLLLEVNRSGSIKLFGKIPTQCEGE